MINWRLFGTIKGRWVGIFIGFEPAFSRREGRRSVRRKKAPPAPATLYVPNV
jgi:hypothetical protein